MADDRLRLVVDMQNKASAELKNLRRDMGAVKTTPGMLSAKTWFSELSSVSSATTKAVNPLISGLNTMGVSGLAAGLSIAGLVSQFRDLGKSLPALQELSRQTGMSRTEIERLKQTASNLNVDPSKMTAGLQAFSREMVGFHNRSSELYHRMVNEGAGGLAEKIRKEDPSAAFRDMLRYMDAIPASAQRAGRSAADAVQIQRHFVGEAFGDEDFAQILGKGMNGFETAYADAAKDVGVITDAMVKAAADFDVSISKFDRSWTNLKNDLGATVLPGLTAATDGMRALFDELKHDPELIGIGAASLGALYGRRKLMAAAGGGGSMALNRAAGQIQGAAVEQVKAGATFAEAVAEFRAGVREMGARGAAPGSGSAGSGPGEGSKPGGSSPGYANLLPGGILAGVQLFDLAHNASDELRKLQANPDKDVADPTMEWAAKAGDVVRGWFKGGTSPAAAGFSVPSAYNREMRARIIGDGQDHTLDGVVVGANKMTLGTQGIVFSQDDKGGTMTTLTLIRPEFLAPFGHAGVQSDGAGNIVSNPGPAAPVAPDTGS